MWLKMYEPEQKCWEIYLIIATQRCHQLRTAGCWSLTIQTQIGPHDWGNAAPSSAGYLGISTTVLISIKCAVGFHTSVLSRTNCWGHYCVENWDAGADILWQWQWDSINCVEAVTTFPRGNFANCIWISENISTWLAIRLPVIHAIYLWLISRAG